MLLRQGTHKEVILEDSKSSSGPISCSVGLSAKSSITITGTVNTAINDAAMKF